MLLLTRKEERKPKRRVILLVPAAALEGGEKRVEDNNNNNLVHRYDYIIIITINIIKIDVLKEIPLIVLCEFEDRQSFGITIIPAWRQ